MRVSRKSWHFRLYITLISFWTEGPDIVRGARSSHRPKNLCRYFWTIVAMFLSTPLWALLALLFAIVLYCVLIPIVWLWEDVLGPGRMRRQEKRKAKRAALRAQRMNMPPKEPGIVISYLKARKQKACPIIEVVD